MTDEIDEMTVSQIYGFLNHPAFKGSHIVIMPDVHAGMGAVIGYTATMNSYVIPAVVGVDIGCGVDAYNLGQIDVDFEALDHYIRNNIPAGFSAREESISSIMDTSIDTICKKDPKMDAHRAKLSLGTLGGNHFIELNRNSSDNIWLVIHSGSRKFGLDIAVYHQQRAKALMKEMFIGDAYKNLEFLPIDKGGQEYLGDMYTAQLYAKLNRFLMGNEICKEYFSLDIHDLECVKSVHNYINFKDKIIRKGAISAHKGERVIIPLNMRDGSIIATGKGNKDWNYSAPHGAGRIMSRKRAKAELTLEEFQSEMKGIWTSCIHKKTLDESPMAYKDKKIILDTIEETASIDFIMKPIYNFKAD
jgi:RNA-splicing ligase RtcB